VVYRAARAAYHESHTATYTCSTVLIRVTYSSLPLRWYEDVLQGSANSITEHSRRLICSTEISAPHISTITLMSTKELITSHHVHFEVDHDNPSGEDQVFEKGYQDFNGYLKMGGIKKEKRASATSKPHKPHSMQHKMPCRLRPVPATSISVRFAERGYRCKSSKRLQILKSVTMLPSNPALKSIPSFALPLHHIKCAQRFGGPSRMIVESGCDRRCERSPGAYCRLHNQQAINADEVASEGCHMMIATVCQMCEHPHC
jgi:hypothetical protein